MRGPQLLGTPETLSFAWCSHGLQVLLRRAMVLPMTGNPQLARRARRVVDKVVPGAARACMALASACTNVMVFGHVWHADRGRKGGGGQEGAPRAQGCGR